MNTVNADLTAAAVPSVSPVTTPQLAMYARFYQRLERRYADYFPLLPAGEPRRNTMQVCLDTLLAQNLSTNAALRVLRQLVMHRLITLDCEQQTALATVTTAVTELAELALDVALQAAYVELDTLHGAPLVKHSQERQKLSESAVSTEHLVRAQLWVIGMGKLGARELNVSSDIDLIYVYDHDGETAGNTDGRNRISNHEYFCKAVKLSMIWWVQRLSMVLSFGLI